MALIPLAYPIASSTVILASSVDWLASGACLANGGAVIAPEGSQSLSDTQSNPLFVQRQY